MSSYIRIDLDDYSPDEWNKIEVDLSDFDDEICEYVECAYDINLYGDFDDTVINRVEEKFNINLRELNSTTSHYIFNCNNMADVNLMQELIEKYDLKRLLIS
jgi:hypothetical protein